MKWMKYVQKHFGVNIYMCSQVFLCVHAHSLEVQWSQSI